MSNTSLPRSNVRCRVCNNFEARSVYFTSSYDRDSNAATSSRPQNANWTFSKLSGVFELRSAAASGCPACMLMSEIVIRWSKSWGSCDDRKKGIKVVCNFHDPTHDSIYLILSYLPQSGEARSQASPLLTLELYTHSSQVVPWPGMRIAGDIRKGPGSKQGRSLIRDWFTVCRKEHAGCKLTGKVAGLPTRVIDVSQRNRTGAVEPRLVCLKGKKKPYLALSHCWGDPKEVELPRTTTLNFKSRDDTDDWGKESLEMASIYRNARLVISAAGAANCNGGLFRDTTPPEIYDVKGRNGYRSAVYVRALTNHEDFVDVTTASSRPTENPLFTRAWAFQERLSARRTLHFCSNEMVWECNSSTQCECCGLQNMGTLESLKVGQSRLHKNRLRGRRDAEANMAYVHEAVEHWNEIVRQYTRCNLTYFSDRLPALSSLAEQLNIRSLGGYFAGLWGYAICETNALCWRKLPIQYSESSCAEFGGTCRKVAPSWSWASVEGEVEIDGYTKLWPGSCRYQSDCYLPQNIPYRKTEPNIASETELRHISMFEAWFLPRADIIRIDCTPENPSVPFSLLSEGYITLHGILTPASVLESWILEDQKKTSDTSQSGQSVFYPDEPFPLESMAQREHASCLWVLSYHHSYVEGDGVTFCLEDKHMIIDVALVLDRSDTVPGAYKRFGLLVRSTPLPESKIWEKDSVLLTEERTEFLQSRPSYVPMV
ncbi:uncharacterized protein PAC_09799 [Phialocephala subalpina]|uniref:Heterokaryon incompatibility domain-containing protein n=1 Tax=Phialocephala subalpina TaxID=576137 RepID=A0A1L7X4F9_9HELO|nr:uncharacterized protein PAC_09799 [Phialocephala subalpina]